MKKVPYGAGWLLVIIGVVAVFGAGFVGGILLSDLHREAAVPNVDVPVYGSDIRVPEQSQCNVLPSPDLYVHPFAGAAIDI